MFVDDAVDAVLRMVSGDHWNDIVDLAGGSPVTVEELVRTVGAALGCEHVEIQKEGTANERNEFWGSVREVQEFYGFRPQVGLAKGVRDFRDFLVAQHNNP